jgi:hypothetical protein
MRTVEKSREDWIAKFKELFIEKGLNPEYAQEAAEEHVKRLEEFESRIINGEAKEEPVGLLSEVR